MKEKILVKAIWKGMSPKIILIIGCIISVIFFIQGLIIEPFSWGFILIPLIFLWGWIGFCWYIIKKFLYVELVVTDKRIYGYTSRKNRVDLPISKISAVGLSWNDSITVTTSSGVLRFNGIANRDIVHNTIVSLIDEAENKQPTIIPKQENLHTTDELKKYKELLDSGIITQEEFNAKKKQLLGL